MKTSLFARFTERASCAVRALSIAVFAVLAAGLASLGALSEFNVSVPPSTKTSGPETADVVRYAVTMSLYVPRVYDNTASLGKRVYKHQRIVGTAVVSRVEGEIEPDIAFELVNRSHKVNGRCVDYDCEVSLARWHVVGDNRTDKFRRASVAIEMEAVPSYIRDADFSKLSEDDTLILTLAGSGNKKHLSGSVAGTMGCGCYSFGHVSPTRSLFSWDVVDVAAVWGRFTMRRVSEE